MTKTIPSDIRKLAKKMAREHGIPHQTALDVVARRHGHSGWSAVLALKTKPIESFHRLIRDLWNAGGTDLHIEPQRTVAEAEAGIAGTGAHVLFRVHGSRKLVAMLTPEEHKKLKAGIVPCMTRWDGFLPAEGIVDVEIQGMTHSLPIASVPANGDHKFVVRMSDRHAESRELEELGIQDLDAWLGLCRSGPGLVIVSGTTNQGKSTTIRRTVERLRSEGIDAIGEEENGVFREGRIRDMTATAATRTVILEGYGTSIDGAVSNAMIFGLESTDLARVMLGGMHQKLHRQPDGPRTLETTVLPSR